MFFSEIAYWIWKTSEKCRIWEKKEWTVEQWVEVLFCLKTSWVLEFAIPYIRPSKPIHPSLFFQRYFIGQTDGSNVIWEENLKNLKMLL